MTRQGERKLKEWIALLTEQGWSKADKQYLVDYWIEHHDEDGKLKTDAKTQHTAPYAAHDDSKGSK